MSGRFAWIIEALIGCVASRIAGVLPSGEMATPLAVPFVDAIRARLRLLTRRFARLVERAQAGTLPPPRCRPAVASASGGDWAADTEGSVAPAGPTPPAVRVRYLPRDFGWLVALRVPEAEDHARRLGELLREPEMAALAASHPAFGQVIRPLCRMLAVPPPPGLAIPPRRPPAAPRLARPRTQPRHPPTPPWTRPLPHCDGLPGQVGRAIPWRPRSETA